MTFSDSKHLVCGAGRLGEIVGTPIHAYTHRGLLILLGIFAVRIPASAQELAAGRPRINGPLPIAQAVQIGLRENQRVQAMQAEVRAASAETKMTRSMT